MTSGDTVAAVSTAVGQAARIIVRASGPDAVSLARKLWRGVLPEAAGAARGSLHFDKLTVCGCWLYVFRTPRSYTGEDLVEFHIPGNPLLARMLLDALTAAGARTADPGEFTARAYFNGRIDLTEAEGVAATIAAGNEQEMRAARQLLAGELARRLRPVTDLVAQTLASVEMGLDFSDEDVTFLPAGEVAERVNSADAMLRDLLDASSRFERLTHEPRAVLIGRPNAGKSTLLNALAGQERAITSPMAGTTRDVLTAEVVLPRGILKLADVAGMESAGHAEVDTHSAPAGQPPGDATRRASPPARRPPALLGARGLSACEAPGPAIDISRQMHRNALRAVRSADLVVLVRDATDERPDPELPRPPDLIVLTKSDLVPGGSQTAVPLCVSAATGQDLDRLRAALDRLAFGDPPSGASGGTSSGAGASSLALNARHVGAVSAARNALARAAESAASGGGPEIVALDLRETLDALGGVTGVITPDDLLGRIFSSFCIGK